MKILIVLTYYRPHTSGLTIYAERLANAFSEAGHEVTILTSQYEKSLPRNETINGIRIVRVPVLFRLSKGVIMPQFGYMASKLVAETDVIQLHLPQFDAAGLGLRGKLLGKPTIVTYHCDLLMPHGILSWVANQAIHFMDHLTALFTHRIVTYTRDYAENSQFLKSYMEKIAIIPPPVVLPEVSQAEIDLFKEETNPQNNRPVIGMAARFASEKGVEVLLKALPKVISKYPSAQVQFAGPYESIIGEEEYLKKLMPEIRAYESSSNWKFLGTLPPKKMAMFYPNIDLLVLPSLNSTEAFGLVQIEAMMNGAPSIASDLPGVRQPVIRHGMGKIIPIGDHEALGDAILEVLGNSEKLKTIDDLKNIYSPANTAAQYEALFREIKTELAR